ncbi:HIT family protein [archaeon]|jgi:histidine triad (HIT) family protein|nr:HIT family protein [archaeon]MBT4022124.1 HIT family protein [archaeon]MBT4272737.1 HIT family protein [archaeon]MBT4461536.1 HIT family protein [archaeon]MBT4857696.1 HIT family protein [archaeon]
MTECDVCKIVNNKEAFHVIYEDEICFALLHESPAVPGHTMVIPKTHTTIIEELDDKIVEHLFVVCNKVSTILFDKLGAHGTNVIVNNGIDAGQDLPHVVINVLPRSENDGLDFEWTPKQSGQQVLESLQKKIQIYSDPIFLGKDELPDIKIQKPEQSITKTSSNNKIEKKENYQINNLKRLP